MYPAPRRSGSVANGETFPPAFKLCPALRNAHIRKAFRQARDWIWRQQEVCQLGRGKAFLLNPIVPEFQPPLHFQACGWFGSGRHEVSGYVENAAGEKKLYIWGKWTKAVWYKACTPDGEPIEGAEEVGYFLSLYFWSDLHVGCFSIYSSWIGSAQESSASRLQKCAACSPSDRGR